MLAVSGTDSPEGRAWATEYMTAGELRAALADVDDHRTVMLRIGDRAGWLAAVVPTESGYLHLNDRTVSPSDDERPRT